MARTKVRPLGHCSRCTRAWWSDSSDHDRWNTVFANGRATGYLCPDCQTPEENAEAEVKEALLDYDHSGTDADGRLRVVARGGWHSMAVGTHSVVQSDPAVHLVLGIEDAHLRVGVGAHTDARLHELFSETCAGPVRTELERVGAEPGHRTLAYTATAGLPPANVLVVEDHAACTDGDRGEMVVLFSRQMSPHLLDAFAPPVADSIRTALQAA
ncbi:hypothetical protein ABZ820_22540 [Streptomyces diacarni]|uniref:hypothetical protein n=1 Tax=Streptomyces diacarni TaxID=2800381 RepID=UPI00340B2DCE